MDYQDLYDDLETLEFGLESLIDNISNKDYKEQLQFILYDVKNDEEEILPKLREQQDKEEQEQERQYWKSQF